ncbi:MAG: hypothetical protein Q8L48_39100 [Archangium sp.]|nr:hypothetical protein [Archangium sp.]
MAAGPASIFSGGAWAVTGLLFGVDGLFDLDGRPLGERRAPSAAKARSAMVLEPAPYDDERKGLAMNVSALEQVQRHLKAVLEDIGGFHALCPPAARSWEAMFLAVIDQLSAPIVHVIREGTADARVPPAKAVGYKLAAGYFGALRRLLVEEAQGQGREVSPEAFLSFVHERGLLVGGNEVCAGPPRLIEWTTRVFLDGVAGATPCSPGRLAIATLLLHQVQLGLAWELFDSAAEARLLGEYGGRLRARSAFLAEALRERLDAVGSATPRPSWAAAVRALPASLSGAQRANLEKAIGSHASGERAPGAQVFEELARLGEGALELDAGVGEALARHFATWLEVSTLVFELQDGLERSLRRALGCDDAAPIEMSALMMGPSRALRWLEAALGHSLSQDGGAPRCWSLRNVRRTVPLPR